MRHRRPARCAGTKGSTRWDGRGGLGGRPQHGPARFDYPSKERGNYGRAHLTGEPEGPKARFPKGMGLGRVSQGLSKNSNGVSLLRCP